MKIAVFTEGYDPFINGIVMSIKTLRQLAAQLRIDDRLTSCGWIPHEQMPDHYAAADAFVFPSTGDTQGIVLVEAMSVGLPCVSGGLHHAVGEA